MAETRNLYLGNTDKGSGCLQVDGTLTNANALYIGASQNNGWMKIANGGACYIGNEGISMANKAGKVGELIIEDGGNLSATNSGSRILVGNNGTGIVTQVGGSVSVPILQLGSGAQSYGIYEMQGGELNNLQVARIGQNNGKGFFSISGGSINCSSLYAGYDTNATGAISFTGGSLTAVFLCVGRYGSGVVTNDGGTVDVSKSIAVPSYQSGNGLLVHKSGSLKVTTAEGTNSKGIYVGYKGIGRLVAESDFFSPRLMAGLNGGTGVIEIIGCTYSNLWTSTALHEPIIIGGESFWETNSSPHTYNSKGTLILRDGMIKVVGQKCIIIRATEDCSGELRGWGSVTNTLLPSTTGGLYEGYYFIRNNGTVIADGEGEERDLNLSSMLQASHTFSNTIDGKTGWYAINKGRLRFPQLNFANLGSSYSHTYGAYKGATADAVSLPINSVRAAFSGAENVQGVVINKNGDYYAGYDYELYATNRTDIPAGLPAKGVLSVWRLSSPGFETVSLEVRYDVNYVPANQGIALFHKTSDGWRKIGSGNAETAALTANGVTPQPDDGNLGWFASVLMPKGFVVIMR